MDVNTRYALSSYLNEIKIRYKNEQHRYAQLSGYEAMRLKVTHNKNGKDYYCIFDPEINTLRYAGKNKNLEIQKIKEAHFLKLSTKELLREIHMIENLLARTSGISYEDIDHKLKKAYRGSLLATVPEPSAKAAQWKKEMEEYKATFDSYRPQELIHRTHDGTMVRSMGEAIIYNTLLDLGITFVYELPLRIRFDNRNSLLLPDFSILSEKDYKTVIYLEHQGMMSDPKYRKKFFETIYKYWLNNYIPEKDVFFTFNLPNGGFDDSPVKSIIYRHVRLPAFTE